MKRKLPKIIAGVIAACLIALLVTRMVLSVPHGEMKHITFTKETEAAYLENQGKLTVCEQKLMSYISKSGFLQVRNVYYIAESRELQMTVYYNTKAATSFALPDGENFPFTARLSFNASDETKTELQKSITTENDSFRVDKTTTVWMYRYARISFHDVDLNDGKSAWLHLLLDGEEIDSILVYHTDMERPAYGYDRYVPAALEQKGNEA